MQINWKNLNRNKCPKCNKVLGYSESTMNIVCKCGFKISAEKFNHICTKINNDSLGDSPNIYSDDNQEALNNL